MNLRNGYGCAVKPGDLVRWRTNGKLGLVLREAEMFAGFIVVAMLNGAVIQIAKSCLEVVNEDR